MLGVYLIIVFILSRLVFHDEGVSLQKLLYSVTMSKVSAVVEPSLLCMGKKSLNWADIVTEGR